MSICCHCGCDSDPEKGKPRSVPQLRRFYGVLRAMFEHWPDDAVFKPDNLEHLRKWALIKAGHRESTDISVEWLTDQPALTKLASLTIETAIEAAGAYPFVRPDSNGGRVRVFRAKSIAFKRLKQEPFNALNNEVEAVYLNETGLDPSEVLKQTEQAA